jgi:hypothetical protein
LERAASIKNTFLVIHVAGDFNLPGWDWKGNTLNIHQFTTNLQKY